MLFLFFTNIFEFDIFLVVFANFQKIQFIPSCLLFIERYIYLLLQ